MKNKRKQSKLELAQQTTEEAIKKTNERIDELGKYTNDLYVELCGIQEVFDMNLSILLDTFNSNKFMRRSLDSNNTAYA